MRCYIALLIFSSLLAAQPRQRARNRPNPEEARAGREIYNRSCTMCHGLDGAAGDRAPALAATRRYLRSTTEELFDAIKNGIKGTNMPASPLPEADVNKIIAYVHSLRATAADVEVPGNVTAGEAVFHGKGNCVQCHMIRGRGGILGPDLSKIGAERKLEDLRAALTVEKPVPPRGFLPVTIVTKTGARIEGLAKNENNFSIQVLGKDEKLHLITNDEIKTIQHAEKSLMPADAAKRLSKDELQDLLAFLARQTGRRAQ
jgi:cytochrome c oxidase cbb3-type subunit 3